MRKNVNLKELCEFEFWCEGVRSVLGMSGLEARAVGIGARKGSDDNPGLNVCQVVNSKAFVSSGMRIVCSNQECSFVLRGCGSNAEGLARRPELEETARLSPVVIEE
jgi:hypothetical protein